MKFNQIISPIIQNISLKAKNDNSEEYLYNTNIINTLFKTKEKGSLIMGNHFYTQLNQKIKVLEEHHHELINTLPVNSFSIILQNQKEINNINKKINQPIQEENNLIYVYPNQEKISVYNTLSSLIKIDTARIKPQYLFYQFNKSNKNQIYNCQLAAELLETAFLSMGYLTSKPKFKINPNYINIQVFYYKAYKKYSYLTKPKLNKLMRLLLNIFKVPITLEMDRIYQPYKESTILAKSLIAKSYKGRFIKIISGLFKKIKFENISYIRTFTASQSDLFPSFVSGIKIRLGGRTFRQRIIPRKTVQSLQKGTLARTKALYLEKTQITHKTKRGAFSFTITIGHVF